jgi:hypothetical protein
VAKKLKSNDRRGPGITDLEWKRLELISGYWRTLGSKRLTRVRYSRTLRGWIASVYRWEFIGLDGGHGTSILGTYPTMDDALAAARTDCGEDRLCTLRDIDKARKMRRDT